MKAGGFVSDTLSLPADSLLSPHSGQFLLHVGPTLVFNAFTFVRKLPANLQKQDELS